MRYVDKTLLKHSV